MLNSAITGSAVEGSLVNFGGIGYAAEGAVLDSAIICYAIGGPLLCCLYLSTKMCPLSQTVSTLDQI